LKPVHECPVRHDPLWTVGWWDLRIKETLGGFPIAR